MTLRLVWYVDLVHTYLPFKYGDDQRSLRQSNAVFKVWPWTPNIWPWCWPMTLRSLGYIDLVYTYLPFKYGDDRRSLRQSNGYFEIWPWTPNIWPWGQKFKIPSHAIFLYWPKEHFCAFLSLSYQNCRRSSQKYEKMPKIDQFSPRTSWAENRSTTKRMPGSYFFQDTPSLPISW